MRALITMNRRTALAAQASLDPAFATVRCDGQSTKGAVRIRTSCQVDPSSPVSPHSVHVRMPLSSQGARPLGCSESSPSDRTIPEIQSQPFIAIPHVFVDSSDFACRQSAPASYNVQHIS